MSAATPDPIAHIAPTRVQKQRFMQSHVGSPIGQLAGIFVQPSSFTTIPFAWRKHHCPGGHGLVHGVIGGVQSLEPPSLTVVVPESVDPSADVDASWPTIAPPHETTPSATSILLLESIAWSSLTRHTSCGHVPTERFELSLNGF